MNQSERIERTAGTVLLGLIVIGCYFILRPFITALLWSAIVCFSTWPLYMRLRRRLNARPNLVAALMTCIIAVVMIIPFIIVGYTFAERMKECVVWFNRHGNFAAGLPAWVQRIPLVGPGIEEHWADLSKNTQGATELLSYLYETTSGWFFQRAGDIGQAIAQLTISIFITFFFYRDGETVFSRVSAGIRRIAGDRTHRLMSVTGSTIKSVVYGVIGTAMAQAIMAGIGFWIAGVGSPLLLGLVTFFLALVPAGPPFIWFPATVILFMDNHIGSGIFMALWGLFGISGIDNVLRPYIISLGTPLPFALIFLGVIGGIIAFGFIGIFLGPTLLAVGYSMLQEFAAYERKVEHTETIDTDVA